jgi:hypothetical protein
MNIATTMMAIFATASVFRTQSLIVQVPLGVPKPASQRGKSPAVINYGHDDSRHRDDLFKPNSPFQKTRGSHAGSYRAETATAAKLTMMAATVISSAMVNPLALDRHDRRQIMRKLMTL